VPKEKRVKKKKKSCPNRPERHFFPTIPGQKKGQLGEKTRVEKKEKKRVAQKRIQRWGGWCENHTHKTKGGPRGKKKTAEKRHRGRKRPKRKKVIKTPPRPITKGGKKTGEKKTSKRGKKPREKKKTAKKKKKKSK